MVPIKTISDLISDLGLRVPCVEEAALLSNWTTLYLAEFSYASPDDIRVGNQKWIGSYHESDLQFVFGLPFLGLVNTLRAPLDRSVAAALMRLLVSFAKHGVPEVGGGVEWPAYEQTHPVHLQISANITLGYNLVKKRLCFWKSLLLIHPLHTPVRIHPLHTPVSIHSVRTAVVVGCILHLQEWVVKDFEIEEKEEIKKGGTER
ncbi:hypothetical protein Pmani_038181 [Petrolisthes manimaculis]|uniref:Carboxylesterase type B domain-containing protein n=1 Tax=Petrolisthes manimaculis TaxID=1843537 RepID=A0AAE1TMJ9_9EUCA|nr:hypothetical protein Pmani_038181 [Petrolisthes manimaculis]